LAERLILRDFEITVYCHKNLFKEYPKEVNGIKLVYISTIEKKSLSQFIHSFQSFIHATFKKYDLILAVNSANGPFGVLTKIFRKKTAINVDGLEWKRPKWKGVGAKYFYFASKLATKLFDIIITDSFEMEKIYKKEFGVNSTVIAYGANIRESKKPELIKKWNLTKDDYYLIVGRLIPDNNGVLIVEEFLRSDSVKKLVIVGDVPYKDEYAKNIKKTVDKRLIFTGYITNQDELAELYHNCFVYFHGHEYGGTNPAMLKALAYGCAVCALDTVFNREMLENGKYGVFFNKESGDLLNKIDELEKGNISVDDYKKRSRERIEKNYTWEKITNQYIELFNNLLKKNG
jgi:glycosyltransferase involved in cell wall biosynthesis